MSFLRWIHCPVCATPYQPPAIPAIDDYACPACNLNAKTANEEWLSIFKAKRCNPILLPACKPPD